MYSELRNKELGLIELIKTGFSIFSRNFFAILIVTLLIDVPIEVVGIFAVASGADPLQVLRYQFQLGGWISLLSNAAIIIITERDILAKKVTAWSALNKARSCYPAAFGSRFLFGVLFLLRLILIIPGIIFLVNTAFFLHAVALRNQGWKAALDYSKNLVKGKFWKVFRTYLVTFFIFIIPSWILSSLMTLAFEVASSGSEANTLYTDLISALLTSLLINLYYVTMTVFFLNLDYRKSLDN
jgi:hypothetical protein